ncbi:hypothetical protein EV702DRAFT_63880 [Suillus placidus]|uniref:F-box domain-containing protein n=1 Tax=Suillus placidus TaxID=48579 RepID=A0A9P6ZHW0_9AGAM|nr:hypothetical protein EV702DRAFT_63880 [Suillus placidus]
MQIFNSNVDSSPVSATTGRLQKPLDVIMCGNSGLETVRNSVSYRQQQLVEEKANIVQSNNSHRRFSSPIWRLPTENFSGNLLYCLPEDEYLSPTSSLTPMLLTTICRRWREVAPGLPSLWYRLQLEVEHDGWQQRAFATTPVSSDWEDVHPRWDRSEFKTFLTRSKCPLESLTFGCGVSTTNQQREEYASLI